MGLGEKEGQLCELMGLFHDLGRFVQFSEYGTFSESVTGSHASMSVEKLKEDAVLRKIPPADDC